MPRRTGSSSHVTLTYFTIRSSQVAHLPCPRCRATLDTIQPNVDQPYQFLAICPSCRAWFRVETRPGEARGVLASLPEINAMLPSQGPLPKHTT